MMKQIVLAVLLVGGATAAHAQTQQASRPADTPSSATVSTGDFNTSGQIAGSALIGAKVKNANKETVGAVDDVYVDKDGSIKTVVVAVGGFLGVGSKDVGVKWSDLTYGRDGNSLLITTSLSKDDLKGMPDFTKAERRKPAPAAPAAPMVPAPSKSH
jgi:hypothetical protein